MFSCQGWWGNQDVKFSGASFKHVEFGVSADSQRGVRSSVRVSLIWLEGCRLATCNSHGAQWQSFMDSDKSFSCFEKNRIFCIFHILWILWQNPSKLLIKGKFCAKFSNIELANSIVYQLDHKKPDSFNKISLQFLRWHKPYDKVKDF